MGYITYTVKPGDKVIERFQHRPYQLFQPREPLHPKALEELGGKGLTYHLWKQTVQHLKENYPGYDYKEVDIAIHPHDRQLKMLSISPGQVMPMDDVLTRLKEKDRRHREKA